MAVDGSTFRPAQPAQEPAQEPAPRRRGRPPGSKNKPRVNLETQIGATLTTINMVFYALPFTRNDALDPAEITALAKALNEQAKSSAVFRGYLEAALAASSGGQLIGVLAMIAARRAARHGILPPEIDSMAGMMLQADTNEQANTPPPSTPEAV